MRAENILIQFGGFYDSIHSYEIESRIDFLIDCANETGEDLSNYDWQNIDWQNTYKNYSSAYIDRLNNYFDLELEFVEVVSPRFYNYSTDSIEAKISSKDIETLLSYKNDPDFLKWANPLLKSRDGFISFYDGVKDLLKRATKDQVSFERLIDLILEWLIVEREINDEVSPLEYEIELKTIK